MHGEYRCRKLGDAKQAEEALTVLNRALDIY